MARLATLREVLAWPRRCSMRCQTGEGQGDMSDTDSFIEEVNEEVRRDRLYLMLRRYGWIAGLAVVAIVGGAAWSEYRKAQAEAAAEGLGDQILAALAQPAPTERQNAIEGIQTENPGVSAVLAFLIAAEAEMAEDRDAAVAALDAVAVDGALPEIYRQIAAFKSLSLQADTMDADTRRGQLEALSAPGQPLALLAQEQLAFMDIEAGETDAALDRLQAIIEDASVSTDLQQRALQVMVALGGTPELQTLPDLEN